LSTTRPDRSTDAPRPADNGGAPGFRALLLAFRSLRYRNFRLFFAGQSLSLIGTWMQNVAMSWLVYRLTGSAFILGLVSFANQIPILLLSPVAGVLADRRSRRRIILTTQSLAMVQSLALATLALSGAIQVWHVLLLAVFLGTVNAFDIPARQAFLVQLVHGPEDLANAIALNSSMFNAARLVGPAVAGVLIGLIGEGYVLLINGVSYVFVLSALLAMRVTTPPLRRRRAPALLQVVQGFRYATRFTPIRALLTLLAVINLVAIPYIVLLPIFATEVLGGDARTLGFLMSAAGSGALAGALFLAARTSVRGLGRLITVCTLLLGTAMIGFGLSRLQPLSLALLLVVGFAVMIQTAGCNTIIQTIVQERLRGRVMSLYSMFTIGTAPLGSLAAGAIASRIGAPATVTLGGIATIGTSIWFTTRLPALRASIRPIYQRLGIIPEVADGLRAATEYRPRQ